VNERDRRPPPVAAESDLPSRNRQICLVVLAGLAAVATFWELALPAINDGNSFRILISGALTVYWLVSAGRFVRRLRAHLRAARNPQTVGNDPV
jgi:hypothetical protein